MTPEETTLALLCPGFAFTDGDASTKERAMKVQAVADPSSPGAFEVKALTDATTGWH